MNIHTNKYICISLFVFSGKEGALARDLHLELNTQVLIPGLSVTLGNKLNFQLVCLPGRSLHLDIKIKRNYAFEDTLKIRFRLLVPAKQQTS